MAEISAALVKNLRDKTGASLMLIKKALQEAAGDESKALEVLKKLGHEKAEKKEDRETQAGRIEAYIHGGRVGTLIELRSETDFVSRNEEFIKLAHDIAIHLAAMNPASVEELLAQPFVKDESQTIGDLVKNASASFGEHVEIKRFARYEL